MMKQKKQSVFRLHKEHSAFMKSKKGADLSMNVIIIAAIALLVLVILAVLLFQSGGRVTDGTACAGLPGGKCQSIGWNSDDQPGTWIKNPALDKSCVPVGSQECWVQISKGDN